MKNGHLTHIMWCSCQLSFSVWTMITVLLLLLAAGSAAVFATQAG